MADRTTKVTLTAQVAGYVAGMKEAAQATRETGSATEKLSQQKEAFEQMGRASMVAGGLMAAGLGLSAKAAIDWDSAWAGVTKTVDGSPEQMARLEQSLRDMTGVLPASHTEIAAVAEAAGQLGIETENVAAFTRTMIDLGETTNLTANDAATQLARFVNVMGTSQDQVSNLGSALVELGNNYATTEAEILAMAQRLSGAGSQIGMSEGQVLGLSTALSSVGIEAEAGGSAMSKVMIDIASSVDKGGERVEQFAQVAGMSADAFSQKWKTAPGEALAAFVKGLANAEAQGKSTFGILEELGITEVRMRDALLRSASAADQFSAAMETGNKAFGENEALASEAEKRYDTVAAKLSTAKNQVVDMAISIGDHLLPVIGVAAEGVGSFADALAGMDGPMGAVVAWGGVVASGILLTGGVALAAVPKIAAYKVAMETLGMTGAGVRSKLGGIASFLGGPWGAALLAAGIATNLFNNALDGSKTSAQEFENAIKQGESALASMAGKAAQNEGGITKAFVNVEQHFDNLPALADKAATAGRGFWSSMSFNENAALDSIKELGSALSTLAVSDLPRAQSAFADFVNDSGLSDTQALTFMSEEMSGFKSALIDAAEAAGLSTDDATLLKFAMGEIGPVVKDGAAAADQQANSLEELAGVAQQTSTDISALAEEIRGFGESQITADRAAIALQEKMRSLAEIMAEGAGSLDIYSEAGGRTQSAMLDIADGARQQAAAVLEAGGSQEEANVILESARQHLIDQRIALGEDAAAAEAWAAQRVPTAQQVQQALDSVKASAEAIPPNSNANVTTNADQAAGKIDNLISRLRSIPSPIDVQVRTFESLVYSQKGLDAKYGNANGGIYAYANGGIEAYANGGFPSGIYKGGTPIHKFAEPETLWEAYISGKPSERERNRQIWVESGERLGIMKEVRAALAAAAGGGRGVSIGSVQFTQPSQRSQLRDLEDTMHRIERGL